MNKNSGTAGTPVDPIAPTAPQEADNADPGEVNQVKAEQAKTQTGKYGGQKVKPFKPATGGNGSGSGSGSDASSGSDVSSNSKADEQQLSWIEIELVGEDDQPIPGERYRLTLPDGSVDEGTLDDKGFARVEGFAKGDCKITFPALDQEAWSFIESAGPRPKEE